MFSFRIKSGTFQTIFYFSCERIHLSSDISLFHANAHTFRAIFLFFMRTHTPFVRYFYFSCERTHLSCDISIFHANAYTFRAIFYFSCERTHLSCDISIFRANAYTFRAIFLLFMRTHENTCA